MVGKDRKRRADRVRQNKAKHGMVGYRGNARAGHEVRQDNARQDKTRQGKTCIHKGNKWSWELKVYGLLPLHTSSTCSTALHFPLTSL
jgi:hypothetical protein